MSEPRAPYIVRNALQDDFPEALKSSLQLIEKNAASDESKILLQCLASAVHPDYVCNLAMIASLPDEYREALRDLLNYCISPGLTTDLQIRVTRIVEPMLASIIGAPVFR